MATCTEETMNKILREVGVRSCGRYGAWVYNSMEDSMIQGREAAAWAEGQVSGDRFA